MLFDFSQNETLVWQQLLQLKTMLHEYSHLDLIADTSAKDSQLDASIQFIQTSLVDAIGGGLYLADQSNMQLTIKHNADLVDYLLAADRVFYHGGLSYCAINILETLHRQLFNSDNQLFFSGLSYSLNQVPFQIAGNKLLRLLDEQETSLLGALLKTSINEHDLYLVCYRIDLSAAAKNAGLHIKHAQILEQSLLQKLRTAQSSSYQQFSRDDDFNLVTNSKILSVYIQAIIWHNCEQFIPLAATVSDCLYQLLCDNFEQIDNYTIINLMSVLCEFLQVRMDRSRVTKFTKLLLLMDRKALTDLEEKTAYKLHLLVQVVTELTVNRQTLQELAQVEFTLKAHAFTPFKIVCVPNDAKSVMLKQQLQSKYELGLMLFVLPEEHH